MGVRAGPEARSAGVPVRGARAEGALESVRKVLTRSVCACFTPDEGQDPAPFAVPAVRSRKPWTERPSAMSAISVLEVVARRQYCGYKWDRHYETAESPNGSDRFLLTGQVENM